MAPPLDKGRLGKAIPEPWRRMVGLLRRAYYKKGPRRLAGAQGQPSSRNRIGAERRLLAQSYPIFTTGPTLK